MRAVRLHGVGDLRVEDVAAPVDRATGLAPAAHVRPIAGEAAGPEKIVRP